MTDTAILGVLLGSIMVLFVAVVAWYILQVVAYWKIFTKAGEAGWKSLIPFYNMYTQYKLTWNPMWFFVLIACGAVNFAFGGTEGVFYAIGTLTSLAMGVIGIISNFKLSQAYGHGACFAIGLILLNPIFMLILGFGSSEYQGPQ